jgi:hypothetical protein
MAPQPFEITVSQENGVRAASNGKSQLVMLDADGAIFKRRGVKGIASKAAAEVLLPQLNEFAGNLVSNPAMPAKEAVAKLMSIAAVVPTAEPQPQEWAVAELGGVRVYFDGTNVVVTRQDMVP